MQIDAKDKPFEQIAPDLLAYMLFLMEEKRLVEIVWNSYAEFLNQHYNVKNGDEILTTGEIRRLTNSEENNAALL